MQIQGIAKVALVGAAMVGAVMLFNKVT